MTRPRRFLTSALFITAALLLSMILPIQPAQAASSNGWSGFVNARTIYAYDQDGQTIDFVENVNLTFGGDDEAILFSGDYSGVSHIDMSPCPTHVTETTHPFAPIEYPFDVTSTFPSVGTAGTYDVDIAPVRVLSTHTVTAGCFPPSISETSFPLGSQGLNLPLQSAPEGWTSLAGEAELHATLSPGEITYVTFYEWKLTPLPDRDRDGVPDSEDNCPETANPNQVDADEDGAGDACDDDAVDTDSDGIPDSQDPDDDNDTVPDGEDAFPTNPNESVDTDGDGIGNNADTDDDNDSFSDQAELDAGSDPLDEHSVPGGGSTPITGDIGYVCGTARFDWYEVTFESANVAKGQTACVALVSNEGFAEIVTQALGGDKSISEILGGYLVAGSTLPEPRELLQEKMEEGGLRLLGRLWPTLLRGFLAANRITGAAEFLLAFGTPMFAAIVVDQAYDKGACLQVDISAEGSTLNTGWNVVFNPAHFTDEDATYASVNDRVEKRLRPDELKTYHLGLKCTSEGRVSIDKNLSNGKVFKDWSKNIVTATVGT